MTVDSFALGAILFSEPGFLNLVGCLLETDTVRVGAPTLVETSMVFSGQRGAPGAPEVEAYATAAAAGDSLLFVGADFRLTDIPAAL